MNLRRIIEQEVDKQEWGLELPKYVMMGNIALRLTDRGTYHRDAGKWDVEYRVEDDKIFSVSPVDSVDGRELTATTKEEWYEQNKEYYTDENEDGSFNWTNNSYDFNTRNSYNESEDFDWTDDVPTSLEKESDIEYFLDKDMYNIDLNTGEPVANDKGKVVDQIYWIELNGEEPEAYNICWDEYMDKGEHKVCTRFRAKTIVRTFRAGEFIFIDDYER